MRISATMPPLADREAALRAILEAHRDAGDGPVAAYTSMRRAGWGDSTEPAVVLARVTDWWLDLYETDDGRIALHRPGEVGPW